MGVMVGVIEKVEWFGGGEKVVSWIFVKIC